MRLAYSTDPQAYLWTLLDHDYLHGDVTTRRKAEAFRMLGLYTRDIERRYWALQQQDMPSPRALTPVLDPRKPYYIQLHPPNGNEQSTWAFAP